MILNRTLALFDSSS